MSEQHQNGDNDGQNRRADRDNNDIGGNSGPQKQNPDPNPNMPPMESPVAVKWANQHGLFRRFHCRQWTHAALMGQVRAMEPDFRGQLYYIDSEGDKIVFNTDNEMHTMLKYFRDQMKADTIKIQSAPAEMSTDGTTNQGNMKKANPNATIIIDGDGEDDNDETYAQKPRHPGIRCNACDLPVRGVRFKCMECRDFNLCERCERQPNIHADHAMLRLATPSTPKPIATIHRRITDNNTGGEGEAPTLKDLVAIMRAMFDDSESDSENEEDEEEGEKGDEADKKEE